VERTWVATHRLSAPASNFPWPDTHAVAFFCMILDLLADIQKLEEDLAMEVTIYT
jgi:hypothetical protein